MTLSAPIPVLKRQAKAMVRRDNIPLHQALDQVAAGEGFATWSLLAARTQTEVSGDLHSALAPGDLVLVAARPGRGKTLAALELTLAALREGRPGLVFSLDYTGAQVVERLMHLGATPAECEALQIDTSDTICADYIAERLAGQSRAVVAIDYLQLLDQRRATPPLAEQVAQLKRLAQDTGAVILCISQIDRRFETAGRDLPDLGDVRLPNPVDLSLFTKACFLGDTGRRVAAIG